MIVIRVSPILAPMRSPILAAVVALGFASSCSLVLVKGPAKNPPPGSGAAPVDCTDSMVWPYVDIGFVGLYAGIIAAGVEVDLPTAIGMAVLTLGHAIGAYGGRAKVTRCRLAKIQRPAQLKILGPGGEAGATNPTPPARANPTVPGAGPHHTFLSGTVEFDMATVLAITTSHTRADAIGWFGEPATRSPLPTTEANGCSEVWTWVRAAEALSIAFRGDNTVCSVAVAGGPPL